MKTITLPAHFDGERILLDEPYELEPNSKLLVTVLPKEDEERKAWFRLASEGLARAYGEEEPEYPIKLIREPNPGYIDKARLFGAVASNKSNGVNRKNIAGTARAVVGYVKRVSHRKTLSLDHP